MEMLSEYFWGIIRLPSCSARCREETTVIRRLLVEVAVPKVRFDAC